MIQTITKSGVRRATLSICLVAVVTGCGGGGGPAPQIIDKSNDGLARVKFVYRAETAPDPAVAAAFPDCASEPTHIHVEWENFAYQAMIPETGRFTVTFDNVPVGQINRIRVNDPNNCDIDRTGATTVNVFANGTELTNVVSTPGSGPEPGLSFSVTEDGQVTP